MSRKVEAIAFLVLAAAVLVQVGLAQVQPPSSPPPPTPQIPGLFPPGTPIDIMQCWTSIMNTQGCAWEIYRSLFSGQIGNIDSACCQAILSLEATCWPKIFPLNPTFPPTLTGSCSHQSGGVAPPTV